MNVGKAIAMVVFNFIKKMAKIFVNSKSYSGLNVSIQNGKVFIDGQLIHCDDKIINITVQGDIDRLDVDACNDINVTGNVGEINTKSGDVEVSGSVAGSVKSTSGDIKCGSVSGNVTTKSGDIKHK